MDGQRYRVNGPQVVAEMVDGEVVAINMASGIYFNLRGAAAHVWSLLADGHSVDEIQAHLIAVDPGSLPTFVGALLGDDLLTVHDEATPGAMPAPPTLDWSDLTIHRYADMADLILLDPVHDIDPDDGWPRVGSSGV